MKLYKLNKVVLSVQPEAVRFLNGLTSNAMDKTNNAFLNAHGRVVATFEQLKLSEDHFLLIIEKPFVEAALAHLDRFLRLSNVKVAQEDYSVYYDLNKEYAPEDGEWVIVQKAGQLVITSRELPAQVTEEEFALFRLKNGIPQQGTDYNNEMILNVSEDFVSFTKGCFLGQEPVSKVHNRSKPSWKLVVRSEDECNDELKKKMTSKTMDPETGKSLGFVFVSNK